MPPLSFAWAVGGALISLLSSALVLISAFLLFVALAGSPSEDPRVLKWSGADLALVMGEGETADGKLVVRSQGGQEQALVTSGQTRFATRSYTVLRYRLAGAGPNLQVLFIWRTAENPAEVKWYKPPFDGDRDMILALTEVDGWVGTVVEFGFAIRGDFAQPLIFEEVSLSVPSAADTLAVVWSEWLAFEGWTPRSINYIIGGQDKALVRPVVAAAAWLALALAMYRVWLLFARRAWSWRVAAVIFFIPWLALDLRWQWGLWRQHVDTHDRFAGKDWAGKRLAGDDPELFTFLSALKEHMPRDPQRVFVRLDVEPDRALRRYLKIRSQFHLLPHNAFAYDAGKYLHPQLRPGDFLIIYAPEGLELRLRSNEHCRALEVLYAVESGALLRCSG